MTIALRSETDGAAGTGRTNTTLTAPAGITDGDILIGAVVTSNNTGGVTPTPPASFTRVGTEITYTFTGFTVRLGVWWKRAASESGSYTFTHGSADCQGWMGCYSGCLTAGTPIGSVSQLSSTGTTTTFTGITPAANNSWIVGCSADWQWGGGLTPPSGMTERIDGSIYVADEALASNGATGNRTHTNSNAAGTEPFLSYLFEILDAWPAAGLTDAATKLQTITTGLKW